MAIVPGQQQDFCNDMMAASQEMIDLLNKMTALTDRWNLNDFFNTIVDLDLAATPQFAHLTKGKLGNAISAYGAVKAALGDHVTGPVTDLIRLQG